MRKTLAIGWKDLRVLFRDRAALILMLGAPFALTLGLGLISGAFGGGSGFAGVSDIPVAVVNQDEGELGAVFGEALASPELRDLLEVLPVDSPAAARTAVAQDQLAAALFIPPGFSAALLPDPATGLVSGDAPLELLTSPARPLSAGVVESIVRSVLTGLETNVLGVRAGLAQQVDLGDLSAGDAAALAEQGRRLGEALAAAGEDGRLISLRDRSAGAPQEEGNLLAYLAPGMAVLFLMYTVTQGAGSLLSERDHGTLARMMATPTSEAQILAGKVSGIFFSGATQMGILIFASTLLFGLRWGDPLGVILLIIAVVAAASGWGLLLAASASNRQQVGTIGTAMMLIFGILGGSFFALPTSGAVAALSKLTPNAWAIDGFNILAAGGSAADLLPTYLALGFMALLLFIAAALLFRRRPLLDL